MLIAVLRAWICVARASKFSSKVVAVPGRIQRLVLDRPFYDDSVSEEDVACYWVRLMEPNPLR